MKILIYGLNYAPELTGTGKYTAEMAEALAAARSRRARRVRAAVLPGMEGRGGLLVAGAVVARRCDGVQLWRAPLWVPGASERPEADAASRLVRGGVAARADVACALASAGRDDHRAEPAERARRARALAHHGRAVVAAYPGLRSRCRVRSRLAQERARGPHGARGRALADAALRRGLVDLGQDDRARGRTRAWRSRKRFTCRTGSIRRRSFRSTGGASFVAS